MYDICLNIAAKKTVYVTSIHDSSQSKKVTSILKFMLDTLIKMRKRNHRNFFRKQHGKEILILNNLEVMNCLLAVYPNTRVKTIVSLLLKKLHTCE